MANILLLEPDHILGKQYKTYFQTHNHNVAWCENGQDAIMQADEVKPDIVIMELLLAGHSGVEFLYEFRSYPEWTDVPILILSRLQQSCTGLHDKALQDLGVKSYLYKPETTLRRLRERLAAVNDMLAPSQ